MTDKEKPVLMLEDEDKAKLSQVMLNRKVALLQAEKVLAQHELAEMTFTCLKLQLFKKYNLNDDDQISETGEIVKAPETT